MDFKDTPPAYEDIIDERSPAKRKADDRLFRKLRGEEVTDDDLALIDDKSLKGDPEGDIGEEMQPAMKGYGKAMQSRVNQWRVR